MKPSFEDFMHELVIRKIRPSHQRIKILEYLMEHPCHPTVDQIFNDLQKEIPTLSKSTVYNTLTSFMEAQLVRVITIDDFTAGELSGFQIYDKNVYFKGICPKCLYK